MSNIGFVYLLEHKDTDKIYVGSTKVKIEDRVKRHKECFKRHFGYCSSFELLKYGEDGLNWIELEQLEYVNEEDLRKAERYWYDIYKAEYEDLLINERLPFLSKAEKDKYNKEFKKKWYEERREELSKIRKQRYEENKEEINKQRKQYRDNNKEKMKERSALYREKNRDKIIAKKKEPILCECGLYSNSSHIARHKRTKKHLELLEIK